MINDEKKKILGLQILAGGLTLLILIIWILNLKNVWRINSLNSSGGDQNQWASVKAELDKSLADMESQITKLQQTDTNAQQANNQNFLNNLLKTVQTSSSSSASAGDKAPSLQATTTAVATTTGLLAATSSPITNTNCPKYINCMPSVGSAARPCQIPAGCQGITQLVY